MGVRGWALGLQLRDWRVGSGQNHHTGLTGGHGRDGGSHRVDVGVRLGGGLGGERTFPLGRQAPWVTHSSAAAGQLAGAGDGIHNWRPSASAGGRVAPRTSRADHSPNHNNARSSPKLFGGGRTGGQTGTFTHTYATTCIGAPTITPLGLARRCKLSHRCGRRCRPTPAKMAQNALLVGGFV